MKDLAKVFAAIIGVAIWWLIIWIPTNIVFSDPKYINSYKPLLLAIPIFIIPFGLWVIYYFRKNKGG